MKIVIAKVLILLTIFTTIVLTGCWDNQDISKRAFVFGVGLDKTKDNKIELTLQVAKPFVVADIEEGTSQEEPVWVFSTKGDTVLEAVREQLTTVHRKPNYSHVQVIVIGEELAKDGIDKVLDFFHRDPEPRLTSSILITKGVTAKEILNAKSKLETIPSMHIKEILQNNKSNGKILDINLYEFIKKLHYSNQNPVVGVIQIVNRSPELNITETRIDSAAVFEKDKLTGWLSSDETIGLRYIQDDIKSTIINVPNPLSKGDLVEIEQVHSKGKINVYLNEGIPMFTIHVKAEGNIGGEQGEGDLAQQKQLKALEDEVEKVIKSQIKAVLRAAQKKYLSDIFEFGETVEEEYTDYWETARENWSEIFSQAPVQVQVEFKIRRTGLLNKALETR